MMVTCTRFALIFILNILLRSLRLLVKQPATRSHRKGCRVVVYRGHSVAADQMYLRVGCQSSAETASPRPETLPSARTAGSRAASPDASNAASRDRRCTPAHTAVRPDD